MTLIIFPCLTARILIFTQSHHQKIFTGVPAAAEAPPTQQLAAMNIGAQAAAAPAAPAARPSGGVRERGSRYAVFLLIISFSISVVVTATLHTVHSKLPCIWFEYMS